MSILLLGETGTGKERLARALHEGSGRGGAFIAINCAALPKDLLGAELFGHTRGAFSGAVQSRQGLFLAAHGGTIFLDEIGDFPLELQAVLLRALQERAIRAIGADTEIPVDVRVVSATHANLDSAVSAGRFRADLYARLAQGVVQLPPLRMRRVEIIPLAREFAWASGAEVELTADAAEALVRWHWPFNVRELESFIRAFCATSELHRLDFDYLTENHPAMSDSFRATNATGNEPAKSPTSEGRADRLESLLKEHAGNVSAVAKALGKPRAQIYRWLRAAGLSPRSYR